VRLPEWALHTLGFKDEQTIAIKNTSRRPWLFRADHPGQRRSAAQRWRDPLADSQSANDPLNNRGLGDAEARPALFSGEERSLV
jgi:hypothetical protein